LDDFESQTRSSIPTGKPNANATLPDALKDVKLADSGSQQQGEIPSNEQKFADSMKNILSSDDFAKKILEDVDGGDLNALLDEFSKTFKAERAATEAEGAAGASSAGAASTSATTSGVEEDELQKNISATLENLSAGVKKLEDTKNPDEFLDKLLDEFGEEGEMGGMMETMMKQLMAKDILYEPLKDMSDKVRLFQRLQCQNSDVPHDAMVTRRNPNRYFRPPKPLW
jgi:peroxin-19